MSWKIGITVALLNGIVTALVTAPVADALMGMHGVSDFEGERGMALVFLFIPAGFFGGALLGLVGARLMHASEWAQFGKAAGLSLALSQVTLFGVAGLDVLSVPRPPKLEGQRLALEIEVYVPLARITPRSREPGQIRLSLDAGDEDNRYAELDQSEFREEGGMLVVPAVAQLNSVSSRRIVSFHIEEHTWLAFDLTLPAKPSADDFAWTQPAPMREARRAGEASPASDVLLRYRVVKSAQTANSSVQAAAGRA